ncbi:tyrosine-protein phosphatase [Sphingobium sp. HBC34]|uniref:Tyrosine-protein phosphatase n=1 Tax=Sphingobium cyanobacteriorum TaxID=3063954 RepID=A0ABT8ZPE4_9SPHN|nr:tyrosine-protein phosphatase [Sphingobium sp. HBC34]MDO7836313.1 tyrosine-protein phosphatase [Sphingobium sp. HBC34]
MKDKAEARRLPVEGARNLRDLGGYRAQDGRIVRTGAVFRGGHPGGLTETGHRAFAGLGLRAIVDLRSNAERAHTPFPDSSVANARYWSRDHDNSTGDFVTILRNPATSGAEMRAFMLATYEQLPFDQAISMTAMLRLLADGETPLLVNCTAGKDRTGIACAILLSILGVHRDQIIEDYALTEWLEDPSAQLFKSNPDNPLALMPEINPDVWRAMNRSDPDYLRTAFTVIEARHGSVPNYATSVLGLDESIQERVRTHLLEG